jgi:CDP-diglyceride synthetase
MEKTMKLPTEIQKKKFWRKVVGAAALLVIFGTVVFSIPSERLAWQGPYVMGTLLLPKPSLGPYVRPEILKENADSSFSLLAFISVAGVLGLAARNIPDFPNGRRVSKLDRGLRFSTEDMIAIKYIL